VNQPQSPAHIPIQTLDRKYDSWAFLIIAASTLVRFWFVASGQLDLVQDEAQYWDWTRRLQWSYYSKGPLFAWIIDFWTNIFGDTELGVRFGAVLHSGLIQLALYAGLSRLAGQPRLALWTLIVANTAPLFMATGVLMTTDSPLLLCWIGALFSMFWATSRPDSLLPAALLGLCLALGIPAKYMMLAFWPTLLIYLHGLRRSGLLPPGLARRLFIAAGLGTAAGFLPILLWNLQNDWVGFRHVAGLTHVSGSQAKAFFRPKYFFEYLGSQIGLATPWWFLFLLLGAWRNLKTLAAKAAPAGELRLAWLLASSFWPVWLFFLLYSLHAKTYPNWPAVAYAAGLMLAAQAFVRRLDQARGIWHSLRYVWPGLGALIFLLLLAVNHLPLPAHLDPSLRLKGWENLGQKLAQLEQSEFADPDRVFYFADSYDLTAALAFYAPGKPRAFSADFGRRMSQYDLWPGPEDKIGWDAVYVEKDFRSTPPTQLLPMFRDLKLMEYQTEHRGRPGRKFTLILCYGFTGHWPRGTEKTY